jgi:hypothetical protein
MENASSNFLQTSIGRYRYGTVESTIAGNGVEQRFWLLLREEMVIELILTVRSETLAELIGMVSSFGSKIAASYPPSVRLPKTLLKRYWLPAVYPYDREGIMFWDFKAPTRAERSQ